MERKNKYVPYNAKKKAKKNLIKTWMEKNELPLIEQSWMSAEVRGHTQDVCTC